MDLYDFRRELMQGKTVYELPLRVTFYARVSTDKDEQSHSLKNQIEYYRGTIESNENWIYVDGYVDEGISGTSVKKRASFNRMIDDAEHGKFDLIMTKEISRFSRNTLDSINYTQRLLSCGVGVIFQSDNINTLLPDAELRLTIMAGIAQDEVRKISERVKFGFLRAQEKGVVLGNNKIWGYDKNNGRLVINEREAEAVRRIFDLYAGTGMGFRKISSVLAEEGVLNSAGRPLAFSTLRNIITNPKYKGYYCGGKTRKIDYRSGKRKIIDRSEWSVYRSENVPPIVSEELWERANRKLNNRSDNLTPEQRGASHSRYSYSGKIVCAHHNTPFYRSVYRSNSGQREVWQCKEYTLHGRSGCEAPVVYADELDRIMLMCISGLSACRNRIANVLIDIYTRSESLCESPQKKISAQKEFVSRLSSRRDSLLDMVVCKAIGAEEFKRRNDAITEQIEEASAELEKLISDFEMRKDGNYLQQLIPDIINELNFKNGFDADIVDAQIDKFIAGGRPNQPIITAVTRDRESADFLIIRHRGRISEIEQLTSFCCKQYI